MRTLTTILLCLLSAHGQKLAMPDTIRTKAKCTAAAECVPMSVIDVFQAIDYQRDLVKRLTDQVVTDAKVMKDEQDFIERQQAVIDTQKLLIENQQAIMKSKLIDCEAPKERASSQTLHIDVAALAKAGRP